jgi:hypothetical protein
MRVTPGLGEVKMVDVIIVCVGKIEEIEVAITHVDPRVVGLRRESVSGIIEKIRPLNVDDAFDNINQ